MMRAATNASIALDERDQLLVVFSRMLVMQKGKPYVYECMLGMARDYGTGAETCAAAIKSIIRRACIIRKGRRPARCVDDDAMGEDDVFDKTLYDHFRSIVRVAVADGGPTEQKALHLCAPPPGAATGPPAMVQSAVFPNLLYITRDRAHRMRSVQRGTWDSMRSYVKEFLDLLVTGKHSLAKTIENSRKFSIIWEDSQRELREGGSIDVFSQTLRNMSYAEQRFDSRSQPLFVIFSMIPVAVRFFLQNVLIRGDRDDRIWAQDMLMQWGGDIGYDRLISAAVFSDAMIEAQRFIRICDGADDDVTLTGRQASELLAHLRVLLLDGAIWLEHAEGTLVHTALRSIKDIGILNFFAVSGKLQAVAIGWLGPDNCHRTAPIERAKEAFRIFEAFFNANFPMLEETNQFAVFDLKSTLSMRERESMLAGLARRHGSDPAKAWKQVAGSAGDGASGLLARAMWHDSDTARGTMTRVKKDGGVRPRDPDQDNAVGWLRTLRELRPQNRASRAEAIDLIEFALVFLTRTTNVERWFSQIALIEAKQRAHKLTLSKLEDTTKLIVQDFGGRRTVPINAVQLLTAHARATEGVPVVWPASVYCLRAQNVYREFFGERRSGARSLDARSMGQQRAQRGRDSKPALGQVRACLPNTKEARLKAHSAAVVKAVASFGSGARVGPLGSIAPVATQQGVTCSDDDPARTVEVPFSYFGQSASGSAGSDALPKWEAGYQALACAANLPKAGAAAEPHSATTRAGAAAEPPPLWLAAEPPFAGHPASQRKHTRTRRIRRTRTRRMTGRQTRLATRVGAQRGPLNVAMVVIRSGGRREDASRASHLALTTLLLSRRPFLRKKHAALQQGTDGRVQYVGPRGETWQPVECGRASVAIPAPMLRRGQARVTLRLSACARRVADVVKENDSTFALVQSTAAADVIVVGEIASAWRSLIGLKARLFGKRLADVTWVTSRMAAGRCVAFMSTIETSHWELFLSKRFVEHNSDYAAALRKAASKSNEMQGGAKRFVVIDGKLPKNPRFPRLSFQVLDASESVHRKVPSLKLEQLIDKLSIVYGPERRSDV